MVKAVMQKGAEEEWRWLNGKQFIFAIGKSHVKTVLFVARNIVPAHLIPIMQRTVRSRHHRKLPDGLMKL
jgi:hypothetical protein